MENDYSAHRSANTFSLPVAHKCTIWGRLYKSAPQAYLLPSRFPLGTTPHRSAPPLQVRPWQGFGSGCSVEEHINYGACLDGRCSTRHSVEKRNALWVVQFLGQPTGDSLVGHVGQKSHHRHRHQKHRRRPHLQKGLPPSQKKGKDAAVSPCCEDDAEVEKEGGRKEEKKNTDDGHVLPPRGRYSVGSRPSPPNESATDPRPPQQGANAADGAAPWRAGDIPESGRAHRKRTPLHFASERGELALVDRWGFIFLSFRF